MNSTIFTIFEDLVYHIVKLAHKTIYQVYISQEPCSHLLASFHQDPLTSNLGRYKAYRRMQSLVYWVKMNLDVKVFVTKSSLPTIQA